KHRPANHLFVPPRNDQTPVQKRLYCRRGSYPSNLEYFRDGDRLLVSDNRKSFECSQRQPGRGLRLQVTPNILAKLRPGRNAVTARELPNLQPASASVEFLR